jgi:hypothetical protein
MFFLCGDFEESVFGRPRLLQKTAPMNLHRSIPTNPLRPLRSQRETSPSGSGEPRAEAQRRGGVFDLAMGVGEVLPVIHAFFWGGDLGESVSGRARPLHKQL